MSQGRPSRSTGGAIYVEFLVAFFPVLVMFMGAVQLADLHQANIIVSHAAMVAARTAVVVLPDDPQFYDGVEVNKVSGKRRESIVKAAMIPLLASRSLTELKVTLPTAANGTDNRTELTNPNELVRVQLSARFQCRVPFVNRLVCSAQNSLRTITAEAALPNQGASYTY